MLHTETLRQATEGDVAQTACDFHWERWSNMPPTCICHVCGYNCTCKFPKGCSNPRFTQKNRERKWHQSLLYSCEQQWDSLNWRWFSHSTVCRIKILAVNVSIKPQIHLHFVRIIGFVPLFYNPCHITLTLHIHEPTSYWEKAATPVNAVRAAFQHLPRRTTALRHL